MWQISRDLLDDLPERDPLRLDVLTWKVFGVLPELVREAKTWRDAWLGVAMILMMIVRPQGLWPSRRAKLEMLGEGAPPLSSSKAEPTLPGESR